MVGLKEQIPNFGGLIGQTILTKCNWLIDYPNQKIQVSNQELADESFMPIRIVNKNGAAPYTFITVDGEDYKVIIDFGSSSAMNLPKKSNLAKKLLKNYDFQDHERERYTLGGLQTIAEKVGIVPMVKLGNVSFADIKTTINTSSQMRIGVSFFKDCKIYIDNIAGDYKVKKD